ncbi:MAG: hypothetical protein R2789_00780 [Microthrixaceae bacterium]
MIELREAVVRLGVGEPADAVLRSHGGPLSAVAAALESAAASVDSRTGQLVSRAEWGESSRQILDALDFTDDEPAAFEVVSRALALADDQLPSELLFSPAEAPNVLEQVAANSATGSPGCPVQDPANCLAIRRGQVVVAESSEAIDACPQLRVVREALVRRLVCPWPWRVAASGCYTSPGRSGIHPPRRLWRVSEPRVRWADA